MKTAGLLPLKVYPFTLGGHQKGKHKTCLLETGNYVRAHWHCILVSETQRRPLPTTGDEPLIRRDHISKFE